MAIHNAETVTAVRHWTDRLFSFRTTRDPSFRFENGQFTMVGLEVDGRPLMRAYSMASANYEEELEFFSIKVANGPLTSRLKDIEIGHKVLIGRKPTGTLVQSSLLPGKRLYLCGTGTGLAPFISVVKDPEIYERFEKVILTHGTRFVADLAYQDYLTHALPEDEIIGEIVADKLLYYPTVTREPFQHNGRVTELLDDGTLPADLSLPPLSPEHDRVMICGSEAMITDMVAMLEGKGFVEGAANRPGSYVIEKAFVQK